MPAAEQERWEVLERIGAYAAGELEGDLARQQRRSLQGHRHRAANRFGGVGGHQPKDILRDSALVRRERA